MCFSDVRALPDQRRVCVICRVLPDHGDFKKTHLQKGVTIGYANSDGPGEMWKIAKKIASWD